jgi:hypothetical protein
MATRLLLALSFLLPTPFLRCCVLDTVLDSQFSARRPARRAEGLLRRFLDLLPCQSHHACRNSWRNRRHAKWPFRSGLWKAVSVLDRIRTVTPCAESGAFVKDSAWNRPDEHCASMPYEWRSQCKFKRQGFLITPALPIQRFLLVPEPRGAQSTGFNLMENE